MDQCPPLYKSGSFQFLCLDSMLDICSPNLLMGSFISFYLRFLCLWLPQKKILSSAPFSSKEEKLFATERKKEKKESAQFELKPKALVQTTEDTTFTFMISLQIKLSWLL